MTEAARIERLERLVCKLARALQYRDTEMDGNYGWPDSRTEFRDVAAELTADDPLSARAPT